MRNITIFFIFILSSFALANDYKVDPSHSFIHFRVKHLKISYTYGSFNEISGELHFDPNNDAKNFIKVVAKTASVDTNHKKRDKHLRGSDFFNAKRYPNITFTSTSFKKSGDKTYKVVGKLSLHGVTKEITINAAHTGEGRDPWGGYRIGFETSFSIKRSGVCQVDETFFEKKLRSFSLNK